MIGLGGEDARRGLDIGLVGDQRRRALVGADADILEDERAEQEAVVVRIRIEDPGRADYPGRTRMATVALPSALRRKATCAISSNAISRA
jgi:hypothetical protein